MSYPEPHRDWFTEDDLDASASLNNRGAQLMAKGDLAGARPCFEQALAICTAVLGDDDPDTAITRGNLARLLQTMGDYPAARPLFEQALAIARRVHGEDHPDTADGFNNLGGLLQAMGDHHAARLHFEQALAISRRVLGEDHSHTVDILNNLGALLEAAGDYTGARRQAEQVLATRRRSLGGNHPYTARSLHRLGSLLHALEDYTGARRCHEEALAIRRRALGGDHPETLQSLNSLAGLLLAVGDFAAARANFEEAVGTCRRVLGDAHPHTAACLHNFGGLLLAVGEHKEARRHYEQALAIGRRVFGEDHPNLASVLHSLGFLLYSVGEYKEARPYYDQALAIQRKALGANHPDTAVALSNLGLLLHATGEYREARTHYEEALAIRKKVLGNRHTDTANSLNNLGGLLEAIKDYARARTHYEEALAIRKGVLGDAHPDTALSLNNLAGVLYFTGDYAAARPYLEEALSIQRERLGSNHPDTVRGVNNLGCLLAAMGDYPAARRYSEEAVAIYRKTLGDDHPETARSLHNLGFLLHSTGEYAEAHTCYEQALAIYRKTLGDDHPHTTETLNALSALSVCMDRGDEAWHWMQQAAAGSDRMLGQVCSIGSESQRAAFLRTLRANLYALLSFVLEHGRHSPARVGVALDAVLRRKAMGAEAIAVQRNSVLGGRYPQLQPTLRELSALRMQIAQKALAGPGQEGVLSHRQTLAEWGGERERLEADLARQIPEMDLEQKLRTADRRAVALALPEGAALVEFVRFSVFDWHAALAPDKRRWKPAQYLAFVLPAGEPDNVEMIDLGSAAAIDRLVADFREGVAVAPSNQANAKGDAGPALRAAVFDKLVAVLGGCKRLLIAPDGDLNRLPFEALPSVAGGRLIDDYQISYLSSGRDVLQLGAPSSGQPGAPLVLADPAFNLTLEGAAAADEKAHVTSAGQDVTRHSGGLERGLRFGPLKGTRAEGEQVAALLGVRPWLRAEALDAWVKQRRSPRVLHLATHGFFLPDQPQVSDKDFLQAPSLTSPHTAPGPGRLSGQKLENPLLRSGLALAGANIWLRGGAVPPDAEDGLLTAEDVSGLDLLDTELATLSACETGLGEVHIGEGVFGLRRAFVLAGAKRLVMSLWKVPDEHTRELMVDFYTRAMGGQGVAEALRGAQLAMKGKYPEPYYWGAFICQGDPAALNTWCAPPSDQPA